MRKGVQIFGTFLGITEQAFEALKPHLEGFDEVEFADGKVSVDRQGWHPDLEAVAQAVADVMGGTNSSGLDEINHDMNTITRYSMFAGGKVECMIRDLDDVVQPYEWSG